MTGISDVSAELTPKRMELLKLMSPGLRRVAILWNTDDLGMTLRYKHNTVVLEVLNQFIRDQWAMAVSWSFRMSL